MSGCPVYLPNLLEAILVHRKPQTFQELDSVLSQTSGLKSKIIEEKNRHFIFNSGAAPDSSSAFYYYLNSGKLQKSPIQCTFL